MKDKVLGRQDGGEFFRKFLDLCEGDRRIARALLQVDRDDPVFDIRCWVEPPGNLFRDLFEAQYIPLQVSEEEPYHQALEEAAGIPIGGEIETGAHGRHGADGDIFGCLQLIRQGDALFTARLQDQVAACRGAPQEDVVHIQAFFFAILFNPEQGAHQVKVVLWVTNGGRKALIHRRHGKALLQSIECWT